MAQFPSRLESVIRDGYDFKLGEYISKGFNIFGKNAGSFIGFTIVYLVISFILALIPLLGQLVNVIISGALTAGFYIVAHKVVNNEYPSFSNFFDGFQKLGPLLICTILIFIIVLVAMIPIGGILISTIGFSTFMENTEPSEIFSGVGVGILALTFVLCIGLMFLLLSYSFAPLFIIFDNMEAWAAMEASRKVIIKNLFMFFLFTIVWGFIMIISLLPIGLGIFVTIPAYYCSLYAAWQDITNYNIEKEDNNDDLLRHLIQ